MNPQNKAKTIILASNLLINFRKENVSPQISPNHIFLPPISLWSELIISITWPFRTIYSNHVHAMFTLTRNNSKSLRIRGKISSTKKIELIFSTHQFLFHLSACSRTVFHIFPGSKIVKISLTAPILIYTFPIFQEIFICS